MLSNSSFVTASHNIPCKCILSPISPLSVINQCFGAFFFLPRHLSVNFLTKPAISNSANPIHSSLKVKVINTHLDPLLTSSFNRIIHSRAFSCLHSIHHPHFAITNLFRSSTHISGLPPFFLVSQYRLFLMLFSYKHILFPPYYTVVVFSISARR